MANCEALCPNVKQEAWTTVDCPFQERVELNAPLSFRARVSCRPEHTVNCKKDGALRGYLKGAISATHLVIPYAWVGLMDGLFHEPKI